MNLRLPSSCGPPPHTGDQITIANVRDPLALLTCLTSGLSAASAVTSPTFKVRPLARRCAAAPAILAEAWSRPGLEGAGLLGVEERAVDDAAYVDLHFLGPAAATQFNIGRGCSLQLYVCTAACDDPHLQTMQ